MHLSVLALQELLQPASAKPIKVVELAPGRIAPGTLCMWVWRVDEERHLQQTHAGLGQTAALPGLKVNCLVFAPDLEALEAARAAVFRNPMVVKGGQQVSVRHDPLDTASLLNLFLAARMRPRPCLSFVLNAIAQTPSP